MVDMWKERGEISDLPTMTAIADAQTEKVYEKYPETPEEWWNIFNEWYEPELLNIISRYLIESDVNKFKTAKDNNDWNVAVSVMNRAWFNAPDCMGIHSIPGWGVLCDLCSESAVFDDGGDPPPEVELDSKPNWEQHL